MHQQKLYWVYNYFMLAAHLLLNTSSRALQKNNMLTYTYYLIYFFNKANIEVTFGN
jgi:hypothetical protein